MSSRVTQYLTLTTTDLGVKTRTRRSRRDYVMDSQPSATDSFRVGLASLQWTDRDLEVTFHQEGKRCLQQTLHTHRFRREAIWLVRSAPEERPISRIFKELGISPKLYVTE